MAKKMTEICDEAVAMAKGLNIAVEPIVMLDTIRKTRCSADSKFHYPDFSDGSTTGCNSRLALSFYVQLKAKAPKFNPEFELKAGKAKPKGLAKKSN